MFLRRFIKPNNIIKSVIVKNASAKPWNESISTSDLLYTVKEIIEKIIVIKTKSNVKENPVFIILLILGFL